MCGSLTSGLIALLVSRCSANWLVASPNSSLIRAVAGASAGLNFGLKYALWRQAVIPDPWPMTNLLLCLTICFFLRWTAEPELRRYLYIAAMIRSSKIIRPMTRAAAKRRRRRDMARARVRA